MLQNKLEEANRKILQLEILYTRKQNVTVEGLAENQGENITDPVQKLFRENLGLDITTADMDKCHRYGRAVDNRPRPVIVRFVKMSTCDLILQNAKKNFVR